MICKGINFPDLSKVLRPGLIQLGSGQVLELSFKSLDPSLADAMNREARRAIPGLERYDMPLYWEPKNYAALTLGDKVWMSDHPAEVFESTEAVLRARGDVLICGLGIGLILRPILSRSCVQSVTVVERSAEIVELVSHAYSDHSKLQIIEADAWTWNHGASRYDTIWLDIWGSSHVKKKTEIVELCKRYWPIRKPRAWIGAWNLHEIRILQAIERHRDHPNRLSSLISRCGGSEALVAILFKQLYRRPSSLEAMLQ